MAFNAENIVGLKPKLINTMTYAYGYMIIERNHKIFDRIFSQQLQCDLEM